MTRFIKRKKIDFRKFINRFQRVRKFCRMHTLPVLVAVGIMVSVIFASYQNAYATGLEEYFYYTYFDLMSGLFAETGSQFGLKDDYYTKSDRVSGKQVWDNFCTWVEQKAKVAALPVEVVNKTVFDELKNLPNTVTSAGAKMSENLSELLAKVLPTFETDSSFSSLTQNSLLSFLHATSDYDILSSVSSYLDAFNRDLSNGYKLNVVKDGNEYFLFVSDPAYSNLQYIQDKSYSHPVFRCYGYKGNSRKEIDVSRIYASSSSKQVGVGAKIRTTEPVWIIKEGNYVATDGTSINDYAKVKTRDIAGEVPDGVYVPGVGWKTNWDIWRDIILPNHVTTDEEEEAWNSRYNFDNDNKDDKEKKKKDNEKDKLPVAIPIIFPNKKPDSTEKDSEKDSEKGTEYVAPGGKPKPGSSEKPDSTQKDSEKDSESDSEKATDPSDIPPIADRAGNWKRLFPFCIPWDMMELVKSMKSEKKAPVFEFEYTFKAVNYTWKIRIDMSDYWKYIKIFRWGMTIFFIIGLFFLTVKFTTFVYKMGS